MPQTVGGGLRDFTTRPEDPDYDYMGGNKKLVYSTIRGR